MTEPEPIDRDCDDEPKLTAEEWAYIEAMTGEASD